MKTPVSLYNRPGLNALRYRVGTYGDFRASMLERLSNRSDPFRPLNQLRTRRPDDPTIALIDAFSVVCEVLTFYQERLANEGFLRTATERRSVAELARLTGYRLRPGVASSVFLAFTLDANSTVTLPAGSRAQSVPGPGQTAQSFETSNDLVASGAWNAMRPRLTRPTQPYTEDLLTINVVGTDTGLKPNDPLLPVVDGARQKLRRVAAVAPDFDRKQTAIKLQPSSPDASVTVATSNANPNALQGPVTQLAEKLARAAQLSPAAHPLNAQALSRSTAELFGPDAEASLTLTAGISQAQRSAVLRALAASPLAPAANLEVHAFRVHTAPFGNRAPPPVTLDANGRIIQPPQEWQLSGPVFGPETLFSIEVAGVLDGRRQDISAMLERDQSSDDVAFVSAITFGEASLQLTIGLRDRAPATGTLSEALGNVRVTLERLEKTANPVWQLVFEFSAQPLKISVLHQGTGPPTVTNQQQTDAQLALTVSEDATGVLRVLGSLRLVVGSEPTDPKVLDLDGTFDTIVPGTYIVCDGPSDPGYTQPPPLTVKSVSTVSRVAYGQTGQTTRLVLSEPWIVDLTKSDFTRAIRHTAVYADSVPLKLADQDVTGSVKQAPGQASLELDGLYTGLTAGRWLVVNGERTDMPSVTAAEVVMLAGADHGAAPGGNVAAGETPHTTLTFASPLSYEYKRDTVQVFGNVVPATQGESCEEILGGGIGGSVNQTFTLKKPPVTFVPAVTPSGSKSTLRVWCNNIEWQEVDALAAETADARVFETSVTEDGSVTVRFGGGAHGARPPTGAENIRARYRSGLGQSGNLDPGTITSLLSRPLGVTGVTNPVAATGGADAESPDDARGNVARGLVSLRRLVSVVDYQDFALAFAGIGKAVATRFAGPEGPLIHLTLAGAHDAALAPSSVLWQALDREVRQLGDPALDVELAWRGARLAVIHAAVGVAADRLWSDVEPTLRAALLDKFSFARRALGQSLYASEVVGAIQGVSGVSYVDLRLLIGVPQPPDIEKLRAAIKAGDADNLIAQPARVDPTFGGSPRRLLPAELIYLSDLLPDMLMLSEIKS